MQEWYHVFVGGEEIICTAEHPFYVVGKGFVPARELRETDRLFLKNNSDVFLEKIIIEKVKCLETTFNFEVADFHTYYIGEQGICVHNKCGEIRQVVPDGYEPTFKNGIYEHNPKHGMVQHGKSSAKISSQQYGQYALDNAVNFSGKGKALYAYNGKNLFQFMPHNQGVYHGFTTNLSGINSPKAASWIYHYFNLK